MLISLIEVVRNGLSFDGYHPVGVSHLFDKLNRAFCWRKFFLSKYIHRR